jgi:predicted metal-dependent peptidase
MRANSDNVAADLREMENVRATFSLSTDPRKVFFGGLSYGLKLVPRKDIPTAAVDGVHMVFNPEFIRGMSKDEREGVFCHEILHCALKHHTRREGRDPFAWNLAGDMVINQMLRSDGFTLPSGCVYPEAFSFPLGLDTVAYYDLLMEKAGEDGDDGEDGGEGGDQEGDGQNGDQDGDQDGDGQGDQDGKGQGPGRPPKIHDPSKCGGVLDAPPEKSKGEHEVDWDVAVCRSAEMAEKMCGQGSAGSIVKGLVDSVTKPKVPWQDKLRNFVNTYARNEYQWNPPSRRFIGQGVYYPGMRSEDIEDLVLVMDTSGSISEREMDMFAAETQAIFDCWDFGTPVRVVYCDDAIQLVEEWMPGNGALEFKNLDGGGTCHRPVFEWIRDNVAEPAAVILFTDLWTSFPDWVPGYPVLWISTDRVEAPFGEVVKV